MRNTTIIRGAAILLALLVTVDAAQAWSRTFRGNRDQVRAACSGDGMVLTEGSNTTMCQNLNNNTGVICGDDGRCAGSGPRTIGMWGFRTREYQPPQSLVDSGGSSRSAAATPSAPAPTPPAPPIFN